MSRAQKTLYSEVVQQTNTDNACLAVCWDRGANLCLILLMTVFSQTFFALVSGHLVAFSFLSSGHLFYALEISKYVI